MLSVGGGRARPAAAKDVSMAGIAGTLGMLAEASGCAAVLDVAPSRARPRPPPGDWLTCFPGFAMITADEPDGDRPLPAGPGGQRGVRRAASAGRGVTAALAGRRATEVIDGRGDRIGAGMTMGAGMRRHGVSMLRMAAVAAPFDRDLEADFAPHRAADRARPGTRASGCSRCPRPAWAATWPTWRARRTRGRGRGPPALDLDGPEIRRLVALAGDLVVMRRATARPTGTTGTTARSA